MPTIGETFFLVKRNTNSILDCDLYLLLCNANGFENNSVLLTNFNKPMQNRDIFLENVAKLKQNIPVEYILGWSNFNKINLKVNKDVLIPRVETEELVNKTILLIKDNFKEDFSLLDVGTGSGAIAISIKKEFPLSNVFASDISPL